MNKTKTVQIPEELFIRLYGYHILNHREPEQEYIIQNALQVKFDAIQRRSDYSNSLNKKKQEC